MSPRRPIRELGRDNWIGTIVAKYPGPGNWICVQWSPDTVAGTTVPTYMGTVLHTWVQWYIHGCNGTYMGTVVQ